MPIARVNGAELYYESHGAGSPVVLVAGFSTDHRAWETLIPVYARRHQVIVFDNRGIGRSSCPNEPYTVEMMADDTVGLIRSLGLTSAHLVGHSFGGCIVQAIARRHAGVARSAVISCSFVKASMRLAQYGQARVEMLRASTPASIVGRFMAVLCFSNSFMERPGIVDELAGTGPHSISEAGLINQLHAVLAFNSRLWVGDQRCPTLLIGADQDLLADVEDTRYMAAVMSSCELYLFEGVGHMPLIEQPDTFNEVVLGFLRRQPADHSE